MTFYVRMAWRSLTRTPGLTVVMIVALSLGIGTWYAQRQVFAFLDAKVPTPRPHLYQIVLERGDIAPMARVNDITPLLPSVLLTARDAEAVIAGDAHRHTITFGAPGLVEPDGMPAEIVRVRYATRDLFELFDIPLVQGAPWAAVADASRFAGPAIADAVIDERVAHRLFGAGSVLGRRLRVDGADVRIVGVVAARHLDRYHLYERFVTTPDAIYLPLAHAAAAHAEPDFQYTVAATGETGFVGGWVELPTEPARTAFVAAADAYLARERASGRHATPRAVTLRPARQWARWFKPAGTMGLWPLLAGMCIVTSIVNVIRMLMAKFAIRRHDLGLLRAFGARRRSVMGQLLLEAVMIGVMAGVCGLVLGVTLMPVAMGSVASVHGSVTVISASAVLATLAASIGCALLAALYPAWRLSRGTPSVQLRGT